MKTQIDFNTVMGNINRAINTNTTVDSGVIVADIPLEFLEIPKNYQRFLHPTYKTIAGQWDFEKCDILKVNLRKGENKFYIMDGQHRFEAAKKAGVEYLPCRIYFGKTLQEESYLFGHQDDNKTRINKGEKLKSDLICGDDSANSLIKLCNKYQLSITGYHIEAKDTKRKITSVVKATEIIRSKGENCLDWELAILNKLNWLGQPKATSTAMLSALKYFYISENIEENKINGKNIIYFLKQFDSPCSLIEQATKEMGDKQELFNYMKKYLTAE